MSPYTVGSGMVTLVQEGSAGANLFVGPVRTVRTEVPQRAVFCQNLGGPAPEMFLGIDKDFHRFQVEVTVRSEPGKYADGEQLVRGLLEKLQRAEPLGYVALHVLQVGPNYLGEDEERTHRWSFVVELWWKG